MKSLYSIAENAYNNVLIFSTFYFLHITFFDTNKCSDCDKYLI